MGITILTLGRHIPQRRAICS